MNSSNESLNPSRSASIEVISLQPMKHLSEARRPDDDWTGLTARRERKKRQNRLNQRAYRRRQGVELVQTLTSGTSPTPSENHNNVTKYAGLVSMKSYTWNNQKSDSPINIFRPNAGEPYVFPISTDHLMLLVQYNLYRACLSNMECLGITSPYTMIISVPNHDYAPSFLPTNLQRSIMHPAWIDSIPSPIIRDNFITAYGTYDPDEFWFDSVGDLHEAYEKPLFSAKSGEKAEEKYFGLGDEFSGIMCWGDPWDIENYEIGEQHLRKWWRLHKGCEGILRGTNRWRAKRGERMIVVEELLGACIESQEVENLWDN